MRSQAEPNQIDNDWVRVSVSVPCPICGGCEECRTHAEEAFACCARQPSDWRLNNGGWLHRIEAGQATDDRRIEPESSVRQSGVVLRGTHEISFSGLTAVGNGS